MSIRENLAKIPVSELVDLNSKVLEAHSDESVVDVFKKMTEADYLSVPVFDKETQKYVGLIDASDLNAWVVNVFCHETAGTKDREPIKALMKKNSKSFMFLGEKVGKLADCSHRNPFVPIAFESTLADALAQLASGIHRLPVLKEGKIVGVVSQSTMIKYLSAHPELISDDVAALNAIPMCRTQSVIHAGMDEPLIDACVRMVESGVSAVPVLGHGGMMITNLSASDMRKLLYVSPQRMGQILESPIRQFIHEFQSAAFDVRAPSIGVTHSDTVAASISKIKDMKIHRLWIISSSHHVEGVLTLTDILSFLAKN